MRLVGPFWKRTNYGRANMYEIKSKTDQVLYRSEKATNIKTALVEAVRKGAYLRDAYLRGADLRDAYLRDAYLRGADLGSADLRGADLGSAYLRGADLRGADLGSAYLRGADLGSAWTAVAAKLVDSLQAMNDNGRHWTKHTLSKIIEDGSTAYCSIGSIEHHSEGTVRALALWLLSSVTGGDIAEFNDHMDTTWEDIQTVFGIAIKHAQRFAK